MIVGFKIDIRSDELTTHLATKAEEHRLKAQGYREQAAAVSELQDSAQYGHSNNPADSLANSAGEHARRASYFAFLSTHVIPDETYRLDERDLERVELYSRYG